MCSMTFSTSRTEGYPPFSHGGHVAQEQATGQRTQRACITTFWSLVLFISVNQPDNWPGTRRQTLTDSNEGLQ